MLPNPSVSRVRTFQFVIFMVKVLVDVQPNPG
jgi:hypothetical protein